MPEAKLTTNYSGAVREALRRALGEDPSVLLYGEDVALPGGVFGVTRGLQKEFGQRVFDTPISETAILGSALGAAQLGMRPVVEIMWIDFSLVAMDQLVNQMANARYVSAGQIAAPVTVRTQQGYTSGSCACHAQNLEAYFAHTPGLRVCIPTTPQDAYDLLLSSIRCDDPTLVIENRGLYFGEKTEIIVGGEIAPIGGSRLRRAGKDITVVTWGAVTRKVEAAAEALAADGIDAEVIESVWIAPFDTAAVLESVAHTGRLLVVHEANTTGGFGAEVIAQVVTSGVDLEAAPQRLGLPDIRIPAAAQMAAALLPSVERIAAAIRMGVKRTTGRAPAPRQSATVD